MTAQSEVKINTYQRALTREWTSEIIHVGSSNVSTAGTIMFTGRTEAIAQCKAYIALGHLLLASKVEV